MIANLLAALRSDSLRTMAASAAASWGVATLQQDLAGVLSAQDEADATLAERQLDLIVLDDTIAARRRHLADLDAAALQAAALTEFELRSEYHMAGLKLIHHPCGWDANLSSNYTIAGVLSIVREHQQGRCTAAGDVAEPLPVRPDPDPARRAFEATASGDYEEVTHG